MLADTDRLLITQLPLSLLNAAQGKPMVRWFLVVHLVRDN
jgi:hypothetical protein